MLLKALKVDLDAVARLAAAQLSVEPGVSVNMMASLSKLRCVMGSTSELSGALSYPSNVIRPSGVMTGASIVQASVNANS